MLIAGKLSGIQDFLFDVAAEGGAQAKRLRARSFFIQLLTEALCLRVADALQLDLQGSLVFCNAEKFLLCGKGRLENLRKVESEINEELLRIGTGKLSFALAVVEEESNSVKDDYQMIMRRLNFAKKRAWANVCAPEGKWKTEKLQLQPINPPCDLCRQEKAEREDRDEEIVCRVCKTCHDMRRIGEQLTREQNNRISGLFYFLAKMANSVSAVGHSILEMLQEANCRWLAAVVMNQCKGEELEAPFWCQNSVSFRAALQKSLQRAGPKEPTRPEFTTPMNTLKRSVHLSSVLVRLSYRQRL